MAEKLSYFLESSSPFPPSEISYRRCLGTCDAVLRFSQYLQVAVDRGIQKACLVELFICI